MTQTTQQRRARHLARLRDEPGYRQRCADTNLRRYMREKATPEYRRRKREAAAAYHERRRLDPNWQRSVMVAQAKSRAKRLGIPFDLTVADIELPSRCPILMIPLTYGGVSPARDSSPSLDRRIPSLGYVRGNVCVISNRANRLKNDGDAYEHRRIAEWMDGS